MIESVGVISMYKESLDMESGWGIKLSDWVSKLTD